MYIEDRNEAENFSLKVKTVQSHCCAASVCYFSQTAQHLTHIAVYTCTLCTATGDLFGEAGVCGDEVADELISSDVTEPQALWFTLCIYNIKPGGVPDKFRVLPADES